MIAEEGKSAGTLKPAGYSPLQKILHWSVVALVALQYLAFDSMGRYLNDVVEGLPAPYTLVSIGHIACGGAILLAMLMRLALRAGRGSPGLPAQEPGWAGTLARTTHVLLYVLLIALPLSGLIAWFGAVEPVALLHEAGTTALLFILVLHVLGSLVHQFWWRTGLIRRLL